MAARARGLIEEMAEGEAVRVVEGPAAKGRGLHVNAAVAGEGMQRSARSGVTEGSVRNTIAP